MPGALGISGRSEGAALKALRAKGVKSAFDVGCRSAYVKRRLDPFRGLKPVSRVVDVLGGRWLPFAKRTGDTRDERRQPAMKTEEHHERPVDFETVESALSKLSRFGFAPGCMPSHGFTCCVQFGRCCSEEREEKSEE